MERLQCSSCKKILINGQGIARFKCPKCLKQEIIRCCTCRKVATKYQCPECSFEGPN